MVEIARRVYPGLEFRIGDAEDLPFPDDSFDALGISFGEFISPHLMGGHPGMSAIVSRCRGYRYRLEREVRAMGIVVAFFGLNPSRADASVRDQTDLKWTGFAYRYGARKYIAGNAFAYRTPYVEDLVAVIDPIGPENDVHLARIIAEADVIVPCWGDRKKLPEILRPRLDAVAEMLLASNKPLRTFGLTKGGDPKHPLMLGYDTPLVEWHAG